MVVYFYFFLIALCYSSDLFEEYYKDAEEKMKNMTMEERIGQIFFPRFHLKNSTDDITNKKPGGFMLFANDFEFNASFIQEYIINIKNLSKQIMGLPLGLSVDEEGGKVNRVSIKHRSEVFPSPQEIYNKSGIDGILKIDQEKRDLLRKFFLNINLAPVADLSYNPKDYIFGRTIGRHTKEAANYIAKDVEGYVNDNFTCTLKHFPGYGNNSDTHTGISIDNRTYDIFQEEEAPIVLVSHNIVTCKDNKYPASLSKIWHDILRNDLNFSGLIMTDDISMGAIKKYADNVSEAVLAINAGNDIILTSDYYMHYDAVIKAYKNGDISNDTINTACKRILAWKFNYLNMNESYPIQPSDEPVKPSEEPVESSSESVEPEGEKGNSALIVLWVFLGIILVGAIIILLIMWRKNKHKNSEKLIADLPDSAIM